MSDCSTEPEATVLTALGRQYLEQTQPWVRFMSILILVGAGFMVMAGFGMMALYTVGGLASRGSPAFGVIGGILLGVFYLVVAGLYVAPGVFLLRFAGALKRLTATNAAGALDDALKHQRSFWRFVGIMSIIGIVVGVIAIGVAVAVGIMAAMLSRS